MRQNDHFFEHFLYLFLIYTVLWLPYAFFFTSLINWWVAFFVITIIGAVIDTCLIQYTNKMYWTVSDIIEIYYQNKQREKTIKKEEIDERSDIRKQIADAGYESSIVYDNPSFDGAIIGVDINDKTVYEYSLMADEYVNAEFPGIYESENSDDYYDALEQAYEWIDYNTVRATPYMGPLAPVIIAWNPEDEKWFNMITSEDYDINDIVYDVQKDILKDLEV